MPDDKQAIIDELDRRGEFRDPHKREIVQELARRGQIRLPKSFAAPGAAGTQLRGQSRSQPQPPTPQPQRQQPAAASSADAIATDPRFNTRLSSQEETQFQKWKQRYAPHDSGYDYDLRGAFKSGFTPDAKTGHWKDEFKKPNHPTFSDQSRYAKAMPERAGSWKGETYVPPRPLQKQQQASSLHQQALDAINQNVTANLEAERQHGRELLAPYHAIAQPLSQLASAGIRGIQENFHIPGLTKPPPKPSPLQQEINKILGHSTLRQRMLAEDPRGFGYAVSPDTTRRVEALPNTGKRGVAKGVAQTVMGFATVDNAAIAAAMAAAGGPAGAVLQKAAAGVFGVEAARGAHEGIAEWLKSGRTDTAALTRGVLSAGMGAGIALHATRGTKVEGAVKGLLRKPAPKAAPTVDAKAAAQIGKEPLAKRKPTVTKQASDLRKGATTTPVKKPPAKAPALAKPAEPDVFTEPEKPKVAAKPKPAEKPATPVPGKPGAAAKKPAESKQEGAAPVPAKETPNAAQQEVRQESVPTERAGDGKGGAPAKAKPRSRVQPAAEVQQGKAADVTPTPPVAPPAKKPATQAQTPAPAPAPAYGASNVVITTDHYAAALEAIKKSAGKLSAGFDPSLLPHVVKIGAYHLEAGLRTFAEWSKRILADIGETAEDDLRNLWALSHQRIGRELPPSDRLESGDYTGARNSVTEPERTARGLTPVERQHYTLVGEAYEQGRQALEQHEQGYHNTLAQEIANRPRVISAAEVGMLARGRSIIKMDYDALGGLMDKAIKSGDKQQVADIQARMDEVNRQFDVNDQALVTAGREQSAAFNARKMILFDSGDVQDVLANGKRRAGRELTAPEKAGLEKDAKAFREQEAEIQRLHDELSKRDAQEAMNRLARVATQRNRRGRLKDLSVERESLISELKNHFAKQTLNVGPKLAVDVSITLGKLAVNYIREGVFRLEDVVTKIREDFPTVSERQVHDALSGYGRDAKEKPDDIVKMKIAELKKESKKISQTADEPAIDTRVPLKPSKTDNPHIISMRDELKQYRRQRTVKEEITQIEARLAAGDIKPNGILKNYPKSADETRLTELNKEYEKKQIELDRLDNLRDKLDKEQAGFDTRSKRPKRVQSSEEIDLRKKIATERNLRDVNAEIANLENQLRTGNLVAPAVIEPKVIDPRLKDAQARLQFLRRRVHDRLEALTPKTPLEKVVDYGRAVKLAGLGVFAKLGGATLWSAPVESFARVLSVGPGQLRVKGQRLADVSASEGVFRPKSEAQFYRNILGRKAFKNSIETFRKGFDDVTSEAGQTGHGNELSSIPGRLHGGVKAFLRTAEYERAYSNRMAQMEAQYRREGKAFDPNDPAIYTQVGYGAAVDGLNQTLQGPNSLATGINNALRVWEQGKDAPIGRKLSAAFARSLVPIVRVPANYLGKTIQMTGAGIPEGMARQAWAQFQKEPMSEAQATKIIQAYKYGGVGLVAAILGLTQPGWLKTAGFFPKHAGGTTPNKDSKGKPMNPYELEIAGKRVPHLLAHSPFWEAVQFWATVRRGIDQQKPIVAAGETARSMVQEVPGAESESAMVQSLAGEGFDPAGTFGDYTRGMVEPQLFAEIAKYGDIGPKGIPNTRKTSVSKKPLESFGNKWKAGIPGLRKTLPLSGQGRSKGIGLPSLDKMLNLPKLP